MKIEDFENVSKSFTENGYTLIEELFDSNTIEELKQEISKIVQDNVDHGSIFSAQKDHQYCDDYFLKSSDKISLFYEKDVFDKVKTSSDSGEENLRRERLLNKIGHALHWLNPVFKRFTFDEKIQRVAKMVGMKDPVVVQSMIIFKNPMIGTEVPAHQDASFLFTEPNPAVLGFWIPLEDATEQNGCLEFIPESHHTCPLKTRWVRECSAESDSVRMVHTNPDHTYRDCGQFIPVPARKGSCLLIDGLVVHRSNPNLSSFPRPVYTFHVFDRAAGIGPGECPNQWHSLNWLQPSQSLPFPSLYQH